MKRSDSYLEFIQAINIEICFLFPQAYLIMPPTPNLSGILLTH